MKNKIIVFLLFFITLTLYAQTAGGENLLKSGINDFTAGNYTGALTEFREIVLNSRYESLHGTAYYWIARCYMAQDLLDKAEDNLDFFIQNFKGNSLFPDAVYQKGKLLFQNDDYDSSIQVFYSFLESYPNHPYTSNSYFWIAESLYLLGHLEKAERIYSMIIREYPLSYKLEASKYKLSLITLKYRESELLKLLKLSHEEYLKALDNFQRKEKSYEQTISNYQHRLSLSTSDDKKNVSEALFEEIAAKDSTILSLNTQITQLKQTINNLQTQAAAVPDTQSKQIITVVSDTATAKTSRLLKAKDTALKLKVFYINWLSAQSGE